MPTRSRRGHRRVRPAGALHHPHRGTGLARGTAGEAATLADCYRNALAVADELGAHSVAFPAISTGVYGYPLGQAAEIAVTTARAADTDVTLIRFVAFDGATLARYLELLG